MLHFLGFPSGLQVRISGTGPEITCLFRIFQLVNLKCFYVENI